MSVAAITDTTRVLLKVLSDILPPRHPHSGIVVQLIQTALDPSNANSVGLNSANPQLLKIVPEPNMQVPRSKSNHELSGWWSMPSMFRMVYVRLIAVCACFLDETVKVDMKELRRIGSADQISCNAHARQFSRLMYGLKLAGQPRALSCKHFLIFMSYLC